ncbi:acyl-coenzyme A thioesterase THEM4-like isoform X1 [Rana temporaria]|uniref:acyl-coenzyme A thioesterase THEM4-like isoform X1 n=1 Tax=Rana temporaria TaxID=8407 RepID=UPI001AADC2A7|nr:acyl-coenzyme A thioesterase THEM4-like isoform X1 [Rana temporaria]
MLVRRTLVGLKGTGGEVYVLKLKQQKNHNSQQAMGWIPQLAGTCSSVLSPLTGAMLYGLCRIIRGGAAVCRHTAATTGVQSDRQFSAAHQPRDYSLPNPTWSPDTKRLYEELSRDRSWRRLPSYKEFARSRQSISPEAERKTRLFTRNLDQDGIGFEYCIFYNEAEKRTVCIFQPGPYLGGFAGYAHGGCIATIIDATVGVGIAHGIGPAMTANLNIDYRNPIPLGSTVLIDSRVEKVDGRKVYSNIQVRSHDDAVLHNEATALYIKLKT